MADDRDGRERRAFVECVLLSLRFSASADLVTDSCPSHVRAVNCWPSADSGSLTVNLEYELENPALSLHNVVISIPLPAGAEPSISEAPAHGSYAINPHSGHLEWTIDEVSEAAGTASGSLEFEAQGDDADACFPVKIDFVSQKSMCGVEVRLPLSLGSCANRLERRGRLSPSRAGPRRGQPGDRQRLGRLLARLAPRRRPLRGRLGRRRVRSCSFGDSTREGSSSPLLFCALSSCVGVGRRSGAVTWLCDTLSFEFSRRESKTESGARVSALTS